MSNQFRLPKNSQLWKRVQCLTSQRERREEIRRFFEEAERAQAAGINQELGERILRRLDELAAEVARLAVRMATPPLAELRPPNSEKPGFFTTSISADQLGALFGSFKRRDRSAAH